MNTLSLYMDAFAQAMAGAYGRITLPAESLAFIFMVFGLMILIFGVAFHKQTMIGGAMKFAIVSAFYLTVLRNVGSISSNLMDGAVQFGILAGGGNNSPSDFLSQPDSIFAIGADRMVDILGLAADVCTSSFTGCIGVLDVWLPIFCTAILVFVTFAIAAIIIICVAMLLKLAILCGMVILPLSLFQPTSGIGFLPIKTSIHAALQLMMLALVVSFNSTIFSQLAAPAEPTFAAMVPILLACLLFAGMLMLSGRIAHGLASGTSAAAGALFFGPAGAATMAGRSLYGMASSGARASAGAVAGASNAQRATQSMQAASRRASQTQ